MKCKYFILLEKKLLEFMPKGKCSIDDSDCINP